MSSLRVGRQLPISGKGSIESSALSAAHLVTHAVVTGMTGSGKTGLLFVLVEEALRAGIPALLVDIKGDLANLLLAFDPGDRAAFERWIERPSELRDGEADPVSVACEVRDAGLAQAEITAEDVRAFRERTHIRVLTPGSTAAEPVHLLSSLERRSPLWDTDTESARDALAAAVSLVLRLLDRDADPVSSRT